MSARRRCSIGPIWLVAAALALPVPTPAAPPGEETATPHGLWVFSAGACGLRGSPHAAHFSLSYWLIPTVAHIRPLVGAVGTSKGDFFAFGGFNIDATWRRWGLTPTFSAGYYAQGDGMDLGGRFQFRSGLELFRQLGPRTRLGVSFHHISNGGLVDRNPGRESLMLNLGVAR